MEFGCQKPKGDRMTKATFSVTFVNVLTGETGVHKEGLPLGEALRQMTRPFVEESPGEITETSARWRPTVDGVLTQRRTLMVDDPAKVTPSSLGRIARYMRAERGTVDPVVPIEREEREVKDRPLSKLLQGVLDDRKPIPSAPVLSPVETGALPADTDGSPALSSPERERQTNDPADEIGLPFGDGDMGRPPRGSRLHLDLHSEDDGVRDTMPKARRTRARPDPEPTLFA